MFWAETFFQMPQKLFFIFTNTSSLRQWKNRDRTTNQSDYIAKNVLGGNHAFPLPMLKIPGHLHDLQKIWIFTKISAIKMIFEVVIDNDYKFFPQSCQNGHRTILKENIIENQNFHVFEKP